MYDPAVNSGTGETAPPWSYQMTDHSYQFLQYRHPLAIHRCVSQPFLGGSYNYPTSPTELQQLAVHQRMLPQNMMPDQSFLYTGSYNPLQPHFGMVPNPGFKNAEAVQGNTKVARQLQDLRIVEQGLSKMSTYCDMPQQPTYCDMPQQPSVKQEMEDWNVEETTDWKVKYESMKKELELTKEYLKDLNTKEDNFKMQLEKSEDRKHKLELRITELESDSRKLRKRLEDKELYINLLEQKNGTMKRFLDRFKSDSQRQKVDQRKSVDKEYLQDVVAERDEILQQFKQVQNVLSLEKSFCKDLQQKHKKEVHELKENLNKEKKSVISLNNEIVYKDNKIENLRSHMKEVQAHEQLLLEELRDLQEQVKHYADTNTDCEEMKILGKQLLNEMAATVYELKNLAEFCIKDHSQEDMNVSLIVGTRAPTNPLATFECYEDSVKFLRFQLHEVKKLREEVRKLQETLTNNYAIRVGSQLRL